MKDLVKRIKENLQTDAALLTYVSPEAVEICSPDVLPSVAVSMIPFIGVAPVSSSEKWFSTHIKDITMMVRIFIVQNMEVQEIAIVGDSVKKGVLEMIPDIENVVRAKTFPSAGVNYLSKPSEIVGVRYSSPPYGDGLYVFVAAIDLQCVKQIEVTTS